MSKSKHKRHFDKYFDEYEVGGRHKDRKGKADRREQRRLKTAIQSKNLEYRPDDDEDMAEY